MASANPYTAAAAPNTMQLIAPDIATQQMQLARQQQLADMLRQQALQPSGATQMVSGWAVKNSPLQGIAKIAEALGGSYMTNKNDAQQLSLAKEYQGRLAQILGGGAPGAPPSAAPSAPPDPTSAALAQGAAAQPNQSDATGAMVNQGGVGPTNNNAALLTAMQAQPTPQPQTPPAQPAAPGAPQFGNQPAGTTPFNIGNLIRGQAIEQLGGNNAGSAYWQNTAPAPTDATKMALAAGLDPAAANAGALQKANYMAPVNVRSGSMILDPRTNMPISYNPKLPEGAMPITNATGQVTGAQAVPGAMPLIQAAAQSEAAGQAAVKPVTGYDASGNPVFTNALAASQGGAPGAQPAGNGRFPGATAAGPIAPSLTPAAQAAGTEAGTGAGQMWNNDSNAANGYATRMFTLNKALSGLQNANTGPGSDGLNAAKSFLLAQTPGGLGKYLPGVDPNKIASYDEANKYLMQYAIGQAGALGQGTDGKLAATLSGNSNTHISNLAAQDVVKANMGLERMRQAQVQQFNASGLPPNQYPQWSTQWNKQIDPAVFVWDSMDPAKKAAAAQSMSPQQRQAFTTQYNWAMQNKFVDGPQQAPQGQ